MTAKKPLTQKHIASLGGFAIAKQRGPEYMAELGRRGQEARRAKLGEAGYREAQKRLALRKNGYDVEVS